MRTKIIRQRNRYIALVIDDPKKKNDDKDVLAAMTLYEGTGCWRLVDVRLSKYRTPNPYAGGLMADDLRAYLKPDNAEDAEYIKSRLREFKEYEDGSIMWCSFDGIVKGSPSVKGYTPRVYAAFDQAGFFSQAEGLAKLQEIQLFWDNVPDLNYKWRIDNPHRQPTLSSIMSEIVMRNMGYDTARCSEENSAGPGLC